MAPLKYDRSDIRVYSRTSERPQTVARTAGRIIRQTAAVRPSKSASWVTYVPFGNVAANLSRHSFKESTPARKSRRFELPILMPKKR
jgi:hypothetical protein